MSTGEYESDRRPIVDDGSYMDGSYADGSYADGSYVSGSYVEDAEGQQSISTQRTYDQSAVTGTIGESTLQSARLHMHGATG